MQLTCCTGQKMWNVEFWDTTWKFQNFREPTYMMYDTSEGGSIDVNDGCWRPFMLLTTLRCSLWQKLRCMFVQFFCMLCGMRIYGLVDSHHRCLGPVKVFRRKNGWNWSLKQRFIFECTIESLRFDVGLNESDSFSFKRT